MSLSSPRKPSRAARPWTSAAGGLLLLLAACGGREPRPIAYGEAVCDHCHMTIADPRFSAQLLTPTGRALSFDDVGCLAAWMQENPVEVGAVWVVDFVDHRWLPADSAIYLRSDSLHTPMASGLAALRPGAEFDSVAARLGGERLDWSAVKARPHAHGTPAPS